MDHKFIPLNAELYTYILAQRSNTNDPVIDALRAETDKLGDISAMAISPDQAGFMTLLTAAIGTRLAVEVGTFTGSSSIAIARGLNAGSKLVCFDLNADWTSIARKYWKEAGVADKIELRLGDACKELAAWTPPAPVDFVFLDADKESYDTYYETILPHVRPGGLILFDNMLRSGDVIGPKAKTDPSVRAIDQLNKKLAADKRIQSVLLTIADGLHLCRKL